MAVGEEVQLQLRYDFSSVVQLFLLSKETAAALRDDLSRIFGESRAS